MNNQQSPPGLTQLVAWYTRPYGSAPLPIEVKSAIKGMDYNTFVLYAGLAARQLRIPSAEATKRLTPLWREANGLPIFEEESESTPPPPTPAPERDTPPLLMYVFDRYWYNLGLVSVGSGEGIHDDDARAVQIMRLLGWRSPEERSAAAAELDQIWQEAGPKVQGEHDSAVKESTGPQS
jgi:hypothetical protein